MLLIRVDYFDLDAAIWSLLFVLVKLLHQINGAGNCIELEKQDITCDHV